ncbi:PD40 domain-containing protein [Candidatus Poribacteria bacterium]|nr:PD40 domain-containing protein [Candidatus Poribacteria bacterium]
MKTSLFLIFTLIFVLICCLSTSAQNNAQICLPKGAVARIGKGTLGEIRFSPDGRKLAVSTSLGIWLHEPNTGEELDLLERPHTHTALFAFSPDNQTIASLSWGSRLTSNKYNRYVVKVWDTNTGEDKAILSGFRLPINSIAYSPDGETIVTGGAHYCNSVRLWNAQTGENIYTSRMKSKLGTFVVFSPDGTTFTSSGDDNVAYLWDTETRIQKFTFVGHTKYVFSIAYSPDGKTIATASGDGTIRLWDTITGTHKTTLTSKIEAIMSLTYSPDGNTIVCGNTKGEIQLWDTRTEKLKSTLTGHNRKVKSIVFAPDGKTFATASSDNTIRLWDSTTGKTKVILTGYMEIHSAAYSPDGTIIATASRDKMVRLWDVQTGKIRKSFTVSKNVLIGKIAYSPDGETIAVARPFDKILLVNTLTGKRKGSLNHFGLVDKIINVIQDREYSISSIAYSPDGKTIVSSLDCYTHEKGSVYLWQAKTGRQIRTLFKGQGGVRNVEFSQDGKKIIATGDWKEKTRVWDAKTMKKLPPTHMDKTHVFKRILVSPDNTTTAQVEHNYTMVIRKRETTSLSE